MPNANKSVELLQSLNEPKIKTQEGTFPAFFAVLQTAINNTTWKGTDIEIVNFVKGKLDALRSACAELEVKKGGVDLKAPVEAKATPGTLEEAIEAPVPTPEGTPVDPATPNEPVAPKKDEEIKPDVPVAQTPATPAEPETEKKK